MDIHNGDKTIRNVSQNKCTGCSACYNICPKNAISMKEGKDGFVFPIINNDCCINCGLCLKTCPVENPKYINKAEPECYAMMASKEIRKVSSSGGAFTVLANWIIDQGGVVCGAAFTEDFYSVDHIIVNNKKDLAKLRGSKYVQSSIGSNYRRIKEYLEKNVPVLFTGTPCQVAGLKAFLGKDYDRLFSIDVVCHGTPPAKLFKQFLSELENRYQSKVNAVSFRDKEIEGWTHSTTISFENGKKLHEKRNDSSYMNAFLQLLSIRESCGACKFATLPRQGDLTLADFWEIHRFDESLDDKLGTSTVLVNNSKGEKLFKALTMGAEIFKKAPLNHAIEFNRQIKYSALLHKDRKRFFELINQYHYSVDKAVHDALHRHFDIGFIGWWYGANYGSVLTSYALNRVLQGMGKTVLMLDFPYLPGQSSKKEDSAARRLASHFYETSMRRQVDKHYDLNYYCDCFVVGSDQLWNWWSNKDIGTYYYFLDFADKSHKKIAYSTSFGHENGYYPEEMRVRISYLLHRFDAISVREASGVDICRKNFGVDAVQNVDPVFLCPVEEYEKAIAFSQVKQSKPYVLAYILNPTEDKLETVRYIAKDNSISYLIIIDGQGNQEELKKQVNDPNVLSKIEMADWLYYFKNASYVVTDSYHGFCFSVIFKKQMIVYPNALRGTTRFESLGKITNLSSRFVFSHHEVIDKNLVKINSDFDSIQARLKPEIEAGMKWLKAALDAPHKDESAETLALWKICEYDNRIYHLKKQVENLTEKISEITKKMGS